MSQIEEMIKNCQGKFNQGPKTKPYCTLIPACQYGEKLKSLCPHLNQKEKIRPLTQEFYLCSFFEKKEKPPTEEVPERA